MGATAPIDFEKSPIAPINFDNFYVKIEVTKTLHPSNKISKEGPAKSHIDWCTMNDFRNKSLVEMAYLWFYLSLLD